MTFANEKIILISDQQILKIPVKECGDPFIELTKDFLQLKYDLNRVNVQKLSSTNFFARRAVGERLVLAQNTLPEGVYLMIKECFRPLWVQKKHWMDYSELIRKKFPEWTKEEIESETSKYIAPISVAPHSTGGAIDLVLVDEQEVELDMGTAFNAPPSNCNNRTYTYCSDISELAKANRALLINAMTVAGFVNYPTEWWHWSYGDKYWTYQTHSPFALFASQLPKFEIRYARASDAEAIACIHSEAWKSTYKEMIHKTYLDKITPEYRLKSAIKRLQSEKLFCFVATENETGKVVGFADFGPNREKSVDADCELYAIYFFEEFQGWGAGQMMFQFGLAQLNKLNFKKMLISVLEKNKAAQLFYEKMGAKCVGAHFVEIENIRYPTLTYLFRVGDF